MAASTGKIKWAISETGELLVIPHSVRASGATLEISHAVLTRGRPVLAAGEASIVVAPNNVVIRLLTRHSGHFKTSVESLSIGAKAFESAGINVLRKTAGLP